MPFPSVTYTFSNSTTSDATQVNQNFTDLVNGISDGTKDLSISALTVAGNASFSGTVTLGNATADDITVTGSLASSIPIKTTNSYDIGSSTLGLRALYFGANSQTVNIKGSASMSATWTLTLPPTAGTAGQFLQTNGSGVTSWASAIPTVQIFTSGTAATYTTPANVKWIRATIVGGGGGGSGSDISGGNNGAAGSNTTFGNLTAGGGGGGIWNGAGGAGGSVTIGAGWTDFGSLVGNGGDAGMGGAAANNIFAGGAAGAGALGGKPVSNGYAADGAVGTAGSGSGGQGGGNNALNGYVAGSGGGAGGTVRAIASAPSATYTYTVAGGGAGGGGGGTAKSGGAGSSGIIIIEEFYI